MDLWTSKDITAGEGWRVGSDEKAGTVEEDLRNVLVCLVAVEVP